ncbi:WD40 domain-containing protein [Rubinisphaera margarita]|uniref:WD40 domain-containing protein n=1 Tax=Rubinisphaera margarita TaxID=2909586 RepID=UPI001EE981AD|nr:c-type cytochrome domain-containing protein [Rubinisphaera margarita]MCG6154870.1 hypothetical protein [Rubinisphaera margarita]
MCLFAMLKTWGRFLGILQRLRRPDSRAVRATQGWGRSLICALLALTCASSVKAAEESSVEFATHVQPLLTKYCLGCHSGAEPDGGMRLDQPEMLSQPFRDELAAIVPGDAEASLIIRLMKGMDEPKMPPEDEPAPSTEEIGLIAQWINAGAHGAAEAMALSTPRIELTAPERVPSFSSAWHPQGKRVAIGRQNRCEVVEADTRDVVAIWDDFPGAVNRVQFSADGSKLFCASGQPGLYGELRCYDVASQALLWQRRGHEDAIYALAGPTVNGTLATGSYDRTIVLWNAESGEKLGTLTGHHGSVNALAFHPDGRILASAADDSTVKLWDVEQQSRLDTLSEPTMAQTCVSFHPSGRVLVAGGKDKRVRIWSMTGGNAEHRHPLLYTRFAHDAAVLALAFSEAGEILVTTAEDRTTKAWEAETFTQLKSLPRQADWVTSLAAAGSPPRLLTTRLDGSWSVSRLDVRVGETELAEPFSLLPTPKPASLDGETRTVEEVEPNDGAEEAQELTLPVVVQGVLNRDGAADEDYYAFSASAGESFVLETKASRNKSPADTKLEVLTAAGEKIEALQLRAIRDSYVTFRPIDSDRNGVRMHNWEEVRLNDYIYMNGEIVRVERLPQGPDSDFQFYSLGGKRRAYFGTTGLAHALDEPIYVVEPYRPGDEFVENGLPVFPVYFENDDEGTHRLGHDSRVLFTAPETGSFRVRVSDVRRFGGAEYKYELTVRAAQPDFQASLSAAELKIPRGSGTRLTIRLERIDGFEGDVRVDFDQVPAGVKIASPIVVQAGHWEADTTVCVAADADAVSEDVLKQMTVVATAEINGRSVEHAVSGFKKIELLDPAKVELNLVVTADQDSPAFDAAPVELTIAPGQTITAVLRMDRNGFNGGLKQDVLNLPHGIIVDNIGLSGILIRENETERQIFLTASDWVAEQDRWIFGMTQGQGNQTTLPVKLKVRKPEREKSVTIR